MGRMALHHLPYRQFPNFGSLPVIPLARGSFFSECAIWILLPVYPLRAHFWEVTGLNFGGFAVAI